MSEAVKTANDVQRRTAPASRPVLMRLVVQPELDSVLRAMWLALEQRQQNKPSPQSSPRKRGEAEQRSPVTSQSAAAC